MVILPCPECNRPPKIEWKMSGDSYVYTVSCKHRNFFKKPIIIRSITPTQNGHYLEAQAKAQEEAIYLWDNFVSGYWAEKRKTANDPVQDEIYKLPIQKEES